MNEQQLRDRIKQQKTQLDIARSTSDKLLIELAESGLNNLLDQLSQLSHVTEEST